MPAKIAFRGPDHIRVVPVLEDLDLFRVVNVDRPHHTGLAIDLTSNYERGARPRKIERFFAAIHMSISTFTTIDAARALVEHYPDIGTNIARLHLPGRGRLLHRRPAGRRAPLRSGARPSSSQLVLSMWNLCSPGVS